MGTRARLAGAVRPSARVRQWQAEQARRAARAGTGPGRDRRFRWPADRDAVVAEVLTAAFSGRDDRRARDPDER